MFLVHQIFISCILTYLSQSPPFHLLRLFYLKINLIQPLCLLYQHCSATISQFVIYPHMDLLSVLLHAQTLTSSIHSLAKHLYLTACWQMNTHPPPATAVQFIDSYYQFFLGNVCPTSLISITLAQALNTFG